MVRARLRFLTVALFKKNKSVVEKRYFVTIRRGGIMKQIIPARLSGSTPARRCPAFSFLDFTFYNLVIIQILSEFRRGFFYLNDLIFLY